MASERLDAWLPSPVVRTRHRRGARTSAEELWDAATRVRVDETRSLGRLVRWRIPGLPAELTYHDLFRSYPFTVLEADDRMVLSGLCGRIWTLARDYPRLGGAEEFREWDEPGTVRVAFAHWVAEDGDGGAELVSEARVEPVDRHAALRMRALWTVIGRFERLVGAEPLELAARRAERSGRGSELSGRPAPTSRGARPGGRAGRPLASPPRGGARSASRRGARPARGRAGCADRLGARPRAAPSSAASARGCATRLRPPRR